jgi:drug/metabolite transporter (DMT)-like permease
MLQNSRTLLYLSILIRILANPLANVFQKQLTQRSAHPVFIIATVYVFLAIACLPYSLLSGRLEFTAAVWPNMIFAAFLAVTSNTLIVYALSEADLSVLGPINAYKSVVGLILGLFLLGERPTSFGVIGVLLIVAGSYFVVDRTLHQPLTHAFMRFFSRRGIQLRIAALMLSATEALFLKRAVLVSSPGTVFVLWCVFGVMMAVPWASALFGRNIADQLTVVRRALGRFLSLALATGTMQLATLLTLRDFQVGYSLALFQLSTIVSVFLGGRYFGESNIRERFVGATVMAAGAALIVLFGSHG